MNMRRPLFQDRRVREALGLAFDFEWSNKTLFYGQYTRTESYFENSELASSGLPSRDELAILEPLRGKIPDEVFTKAYRSAEDGRLGQQPREPAPRGGAAEGGRLGAAGRQADEGRRAVQRSRSCSNSPLFERVALPYAKNLEKIGITANVRTVDTSQYRRRTDSFDYDMIVAGFGASESPGNEQRDYWGSEAAKREGSRNAIGIADPSIDALVERLIASPDRKSLVTRTRALDRVLLWNQYVVPELVHRQRSHRVLGQVRQARAWCRRTACRSTPGGSTPRRPPRSRSGIGK